MGDDHESSVMIHSGPTNNRRIARTYQPPNVNDGNLEPADVQLAVTDQSPDDIQDTHSVPDKSSVAAPTKYSYLKAEDVVLKMIKADSDSKFWWFWTRYVRWWIRMVVMVIFCMYWLMVLDNLVTLRHHQTARFYTSSTTKQHDPNQLPDLLLDLGYIDNSSADAFVEATPAVAVCLMILTVLVRRKYAVLAEVIWVESIMLFLIALVQIMTGYPEPNPKKSVCWIPEYDSYGPWVWMRVATTFCGDCMWSGHTYHTLFGFIMFYRHFFPDLLTRINLWLYTCLYWTFFGLWFIAFEICLLGTHYHYTSDVLVSIILTLFLCTNRAVLAPGVAFLYPVLKSNQVYIHLLPEAYKLKLAPEEEHPAGLGQYV